MNVLILYYTRTGNIRKLAEKGEEGGRSVEGVDALMKSTQEVTKEAFVNAHGIIVGSPVYIGIMATDLKGVFDEFVGVWIQTEGKVGAAFATSSL